MEDLDRTYFQRRADEERARAQAATGGGALFYQRLAQTYDRFAEQGNAAPVSPSYIVGA